ncbi:MAG: family 10 glycosylhydrolase [Proteobacteria bacterium]|nr:family 10 glycosylhydrolase [Pseudomonadota bacterium]
MLLLGHAFGGEATPAAAESAKPSSLDAPPAPREFRAAWVASVTNIDWPSRRDLTTVQQQAEIIALLDRAQSLKLNAIVLQVRPSADALYPSALEPWSEYLTGEQGRAPDPFYDPLKMWIAEAHRRGIELHAWFNPYRARHIKARSPPSPQHLSITQPQLVKKYGDYLWIDPGEPAAVRHTLAVVLDVVRRYDIDGVQIDDYFYPYPIEAPSDGGNTNPGLSPTRPKRNAAELEFPDEPSWQAYLAKGGYLARADWRRKNVDDLIELLYREIHREKKWLRFGVSPFGLGRPDNRPPGIAGFSQYDKLYANVELWLNRGWLDYLAPQLYWPINQPPQAFGVLLDYWAGENRLERHLWPGLFTSRIENADNPNNATKSWQPDEIQQQIDMLRSRAQVGGHIHFSMVALMENRKGIADMLRSGQYANAALVPATPWLDANVPPLPVVEVKKLPETVHSFRLRLRPGDGKPPASYAIWTRYGNQWRFSVQPAAYPEFDLVEDASLGEIDAIVVTAVDRLGNESPRVSVNPKIPSIRQ